MIRRSTAEDGDWIRDVAAEVYAPLGDYRTIIPSWLAQPGVLGFVYEDETAGGDPRRGFILLGFYDLPQKDGAYIADLLAIAVAPAHQAKGVGKQLLEYAVELATLAGQRVPVPEMRLTVADTNTGAQRLFRRFGFENLDEHHGTYDEGQRAIRMRRRLG
jgi:ribosomal protein S18 acetylase RimI-like enzyme